MASDAGLSLAEVRRDAEGHVFEVRESGGESIYIAHMNGMSDFLRGYLAARGLKA